MKGDGGHAGFSDLENYEPDILDQVGKADGYATLEELEREGQPVDLQNPEVPLALAYFVLDCHDSDSGSSYWAEGWASSLAALASDLAGRCLEAEQRLDALAPSWRKEVRQDQAAAMREMSRHVRQSNHTREPLAEKRRKRTP